jgi:Na+/H+-dicarboxylate symporter
MQTGIYWYYTKKNPLLFGKAVTQALMTAFGTR